MGRLILLSGGIDSAVALAQSRELDPAVRALWVDYGQQNAQNELRAARLLAKRALIDLHVLSVSLCPGYGGSLVRGGELAGKPTVVPFRNGWLLAFGVGMADSLGYQTVVIGSHASDHAIYPDCRGEFTEGMRKAAKHGTDGGIGISQPFLGMTKAEVIALGRRLGVPFELTWSCYTAADEPCGECGACTERARAFAEVAAAGS